MGTGAKGLGAGVPAPGRQEGVTVPGGRQVLFLPASLWQGLRLLEAWGEARWELPRKGVPLAGRLRAQAVPGAQPRHGPSPRRRTHRWPWLQHTT